MVKNEYDSLCPEANEEMLYNENNKLGYLT